MRLDQEVAAAAADENEQRKARRKTEREARLTKATEAFTKVFGEPPQQTVAITDGSVRIDHDGIRFRYGHVGGSAYPTLAVVLQCADCGQEHYGSSTSVYGHGDNPRRHAVEQIARLMSGGAYTGHHCWQKELGDVRAAIRTAAAYLKTTEEDVVNRALYGS